MPKILNIKDNYKKHLYALFFVVSMLLVGLISIPVFNVFSPHILDNVYKGLLLISTRNGLSIQTIKISGNKFISDKTIVQITDLYPNKPTLLTSPSKILDNLQDHNGWFENISVRRVFPSDIYIKVQENTPTALWHDASHQRPRLITSNSSVIHLSRNDKFTPQISDIIHSLPKISSDNPNTPQLWSELRKELIHFPSILKRTIKVNLVGSRRWNLVLNSDEVIKLPENKVYDKLKMLTNLDTKFSILSRRLLVIDLRFDSYVLVRVKTKAQDISNTTADLHVFAREEKS